jgi:hypothetical protein
MRVHARRAIPITLEAQMGRLPAERARIERAVDNILEPEAGGAVIVIARAWPSIRSRDRHERVDSIGHATPRRKGKRPDE